MRRGMPRSGSRPPRRSVLRHRRVVRRGRTARTPSAQSAGRPPQYLRRAQRRRARSPTTARRSFECSRRQSVSRWRGLSLSGRRLSRLRARPALRSARSSPSATASRRVTLDAACDRASGATQPRGRRRAPARSRSPAGCRPHRTDAGRAGRPSRRPASPPRRARRRSVRRPRRCSRSPGCLDGSRAA